MISVAKAEEKRKVQGIEHRWKSISVLETDRYGYRMSLWTSDLRRTLRSELVPSKQEQAVPPSNQKLRGAGLKLNIEAANLYRPSAISVVVTWDYYGGSGIEYRGANRMPMYAVHPHSKGQGSTRASAVLAGLCIQRFEFQGPCVFTWSVSRLLQILWYRDGCTQS